jgi:hypothetical protein
MIKELCESKTKPPYMLIIFINVDYKKTKIINVSIGIINQAFFSANGI